MISGCGCATGAASLVNHLVFEANGRHDRKLVGIQDMLIASVGSRMIVDGAYGMKLS